MNSEHTRLATLVFAYFLGFGVLTEIGGLIGYVKAKSVASLVAGAISGGLLQLGAILFWIGHVRGGLIVLLIVSLLLLGRFVPALLRGRMNPAAYVAPLSLIGALLSGWLLSTVHLQ